jgi:hypothetical protein
MKKYYCFLLLLTSLILISCSTTQELNSQKKTSSVLIMPMTNSNGQYFVDDQAWNRLVWDFQSKGFNVINDKSIWEKISETNYELSHLKDFQVMEISKLAKTDLIVYRTSQNQISVFDRNKRTFVLENYLVDFNYPFLSDFGNTNFDNLVMKLKGLDY